MQHLLFSSRGLLKTFLFFCFVFSAFKGSAQTIIDRIEIINPATNTASKAGEAYPHYENVWFLSGCLNDLVYITMKQSGNYVLKNSSSTIIAKSNGSSFLTAKFTEVNSSYVVNLDENVSEALNVLWTEQPSDITSMTWNVGNNDTLGICEKTSFSPPLGISYYTSGSNTSSNSEINSSFFYEVNGVAFSKLNVRSLKNGDIIRIGKPKGVDVFNFPSCSVEKAETLYSQKVVVKWVNTAGSLYEARRLEGYREICPGDSILLSVFYSQCMGSYVKNGEPYATNTWIEPNTPFYSPYKQAMVTTPGVYNLVQTLVPNCGYNKFNCPSTSLDFVVVAKNNCKEHRIFGTVYHDGNGNSNFEKSETVYAGVTIKINDLLTDTVIGYAYTDLQGSYNFKTDASLVNGVKLSVVNTEYSTANVSLPKANTFDKVNLPTYRLENNVKIELSTGRNRPGFLVPIYLTVSNLSATSVSYCDVTLDLDKKYFQLGYLSMTPTSVSNNMLVWRLDSLKPGEQKQIVLQARLSLSAVLGTTTSSRVSIVPMPLDANIEDNETTFYSVISGSFDPNEKVLRTNSLYKDFVQDTATLDYTVHFQNMGTDTAFTVVIKDKLSPLLDFGTFAMLDASHPYNLKLEEDTLVWIFSYIHLPDNKVNEPASHGHVHFKIKPKLKTPSGGKIQNKAAIYFDYNEPVITNTTSCTLGVPIVSELEKESIESEINYYPNPTSGGVTVLSRTEGKWELLDINGQVLKTAQLQAGTQTVDVSEFHAGSYLCRLSRGDKVRYAKLVKIE